MMPQPRATLVRTTPHLIILLGIDKDEFTRHLPEEERQKFHLVSAFFPDHIRVYDPDPETGISWHNHRLHGGMPAFERLCEAYDEREALFGRKIGLNLLADALDSLPTPIREILDEAMSVNIVARLDGNIQQATVLEYLVNVCIYRKSPLQTFILHPETSDDQGSIAENHLWVMERISNPANRIQRVSLPLSEDVAKGVVGGKESRGEVLASIASRIRERAQEVQVAVDRNPELDTRKFDDTWDDPPNARNAPFQSLGTAPNERPELSPGGILLFTLRELIDRELQIIAERGNRRRATPEALPDLPLAESSIPAFEKGDLVILGYRAPGPPPDNALLALAMQAGLNRGAGAIHLTTGKPNSLAFDLLRSFTGIDSLNLLMGHVTDEEWERLNACGESVSRVPMVVAAGPRLTLESLRKVVADGGKKLAGAPLELILIDHFQKVKLSEASHAMSLEEELPAMLRELKGLAGDAHAAVICTALFPSRSVDDHERQVPPSLSEIPAFAEHSDLLCCFIDDEYFNHRKRTRIREARLIVLENKRGLPGIIDLWRQENRFDDEY